MTIPKTRPELSVKSRSLGRQAGNIDEASGKRIEEALADRGIPWLVERSKLSDSTVRDAIKRGPSTARVAVAISKALSVNIEWLLTGATLATDTAKAIDARAAEFDNRSEDPFDRQLLKMFHSLSLREREGVFSLLCKLSGTVVEQVDLHRGAWSTVQSQSQSYGGEPDM